MLISVPTLAKHVQTGVLRMDFVWGEFAIVMKVTMGKIAVLRCALALITITRPPTVAQPFAQVAPTKTSTQYPAKHAILPVNNASTTPQPAQDAFRQ